MSINNYPNEPARRAAAGRARTSIMDNSGTRIQANPFTEEIVFKLNQHKHTANLGEAAGTKSVH